MAESTLSLDYPSIARRVSNHQGQGEVYATGTIAIAAGVVTFTGATVPAWAKDGVLEVGTAIYTINTRDSGTQVTLDDTSVTVAAGAAYVLFHASEPEWRQMRDVVQDGLSLFYSSHKWRFLRPVTTLTLNESYNTGTVTVVDGVVTLASGTFPSWAADGEFTVNGISYSVNTRDSGTQITLDDLTVDADAGTTYNLEQIEYDLPDDWSGWDEPMTYQPGESLLRPAITFVDESQIRLRRQQNLGISFQPRYAALRAVTHAPTTGTRYQVVFETGPDDDYVLDYRYRSRPNDLTPTNKYPVGGPEHDQTILAAILMCAEGARDDQPGYWAQKFALQLEMSKRLHDEETAPKSLGYMTENEGYPASGLPVEDSMVSSPYGLTPYAGPW
jgi:hypothetical protein